jgi:hypothetical protein
MALILRQSSPGPLTFPQGDQNLQWLESGSLISASVNNTTGEVTLFRASTVNTSTGAPGTPVANVSFSLSPASSNFFDNIYVGDTSGITSSSGNWQITASQGNLLFQYWDTGSSTWITDTYLDPSGFIIPSGSVVSASYAATASYVNTLNQDIYITGSLEVTTGATGTFASQDGKTITVTGGIITSIV